MRRRSCSVAVRVGVLVAVLLLPAGAHAASAAEAAKGITIAVSHEVRDVITFGEPVEVAGTVSDAIIAIAADVRLTPTARVGGDVYVLGGAFIPSPDARLGGSVTVVSPALLAALTGVRHHLAALVGGLLVARLAFLLAVWITAWHIATTGFAERHTRRLAARPVRVLGLGLLWANLLALTALVAGLTIIALPLAVLLLLLLAGEAIVGLAVAFSWVRSPVRFSRSARRALVASMAIQGLLPVVGEAWLLGAAAVGLGATLSALAEARALRPIALRSPQ